MTKRAVTFEIAEAIRREYLESLRVSHVTTRGRQRPDRSDRLLGAVTQKELGEKYGIHQTRVSQILRGVSYRGREQRLGFNDPIKYLPYELRMTIRALFERGYTTRQIHKLEPNLSVNRLNYYRRQVEAGWEPVAPAYTQSSVYQDEIDRLRRVARGLEEPARVPNKYKPVDWGAEPVLLASGSSTLQASARAGSRRRVEAPGEGKYVKYIG